MHSHHDLESHESDWQNGSGYLDMIRLFRHDQVMFRWSGMLVVRLCQTGRVMSRWSGYAEVVSYLNGVGQFRHGRVTSAWPSSYIVRLIYGRVIRD
jgi:hypothetical protein